MSKFRLIDANVLKFKKVAEVNGVLTHVLTAEDIDNAPTIYPICEDKVCKYRAKFEWIPVTTRPMTDEEYDDYKSEFGEYVERPYMFTGPMPESDQEILVSSKYGVSLDTCIFDEYGFGLESNGDWDGILAWMPLPEKYNSEVQKDD